MTTDRPRPQHARRRVPARSLRAAVRRYGWRAYALPVLAAVTAWVVVVGLSGPTTPGSGGRAVAATRPTVTSSSTPASARPPDAPSGPVAGEALAAASASRAATRAAQAQAAAAAAQAADDAAHCAANTVPQLVLVSIAAQRAWMCAGPTLARATPVTTGRSVDGHDTPLGTWHIQGAQTDRVLTGPGYAMFVHYWMPYDGDYGIHDATWQTFPFGGPQWQTDGSHGCVHMPLDVMGWLYGWARVGTTVTVGA